MPVNGLIVQWDQLRLGLSIPGGSGSLSSLWTPDAITVSTGLSISVNPGGTVTYNGPHAPFGGYTVSGSSMDVYLNNWRLYGVNPGGVNYLFHVFCDSIDIYVDGSFSVTLAGFDAVSNALGPSWVPIFCGLVQVTSNLGVATGGWQYKIGSTWYSLPVTIPPTGSNPATVDTELPFLPPAPFGLTFQQSVISTSTWGAQIDATGFQVFTFYPDGNVKTLDSQSWNGTVFLVPDLPKSIERMNTDFAAGFFAFNAPLVASNGFRQWFVRQPGGPDTYDGFAQALASTQITPRATHGAEEVGFPQSALEGFFNTPTYAPCGTFQSKSHQFNSDGMGNILNQIELLTYTFPNYEDCNANGYLTAPYMEHAVLVALYFNSAVAHPHWSIGYTTGPWDLHGSPTNGEDYWLPIREQYLSAQKRRNHIVSCPLENGGWNPFLDAFFANPLTGLGMRWIGNCRWKTDTVTPIASLTCDASSSPNWSVLSGSCTLAFGSTITVTPISATCSFRLALESFDFSPFFLAQIAASVYLNWPLTNIDSVSVFVKSSDGTTQTLLEINLLDGFTTPDHTYPFPQTLDAKYAGSWGIDNGLGVVSDTGIDFKAGGNSPAIMGSVETQVGFGMELGRQGAYIVFVVTPTSTSSTFQINYPRFNTATSKLLIQENGQIADYLYANGPGVRLGNHGWVSGGAFVDPPFGSGLGYKGSVTDWLADKRGLLLGVTPTGGTPSLTTECASLYDSFEGNSPVQVSRASLWFALPPNPALTHESAYKVALVNSWSEVPPLACFPAFNRDPDTWLPTTTPVQKTWAYCQLPRRIPSAGSRVDLFKPDGTTKVTTLSALSIAGWFLTESSPIVDNTETINWWIMTTGSGNTKWANVTPWHGWFCLLTIGTSSGIDLTRDRFGMVYSALSDGSQITVSRFNFADVNDTFTAFTGTANNAGICCTPKNYLFIVYDDGTTSYIIRSTNSGKTWSSPMSVATGTWPEPAVDETSATEFMAIHDGAQFNCWVKRTEDVDFVQKGKIVTVAAGKSGLIVRSSVNNELVFEVSDSGTIRRFLGTNMGVNWSEA